MIERQGPRMSTAGHTAVVVGCGRIGSLYDSNRAEAPHDPLTHAGAYCAHPNVQLVAGVDPVAQRRTQFTAQWGVPTYASVEDLLAEVRPPDLWSICTPPENHVDMVAAAVRAGARGIWCEKPLADTVAQAVRLVHACEQAGVALSVNHSRRFDAFHQDIARRLQAQEWGRIERVVIHYVRGLANYGTHAFDLLRFLLHDELDWVCAWEELHEPESDASLTVAGSTANGVCLSLLPSRRAFYNLFDVELWGQTGRVNMTHLGRRVQQYRVGPSPDWQELQVLVETPGQFLDGMRGMTMAAVSNLIAHLERGEPLLSIGQDGVLALAAVEAARQSAQRQGRRIKIAQLLAETGEAANVH